MSPYYDEGGITIYHGDCRDVLPTLEPGGSIVTDPPYAIGVAYDGYQDGGKELDALIGDVWPLFIDHTNSVALTPGVGNIHRWPRPRWVLCWFHPAGNGSGPWGFCTWQPVLVYGPDPYLAAGLGRRPDGVEHMPTASRWDADHPCPKPVSLMRWIIERTSINRMDTIVDPFVGSGSTLRAAKDLGRRAVGIEQSERYCEIAALRCGQEVLALEAS